MGVDPLSFLLGFGSASGLSYAVYRNRERLSRVPAAVPSAGSIANLRDLLRQSADKRYTIELTNYLQGKHLGGELVDLTTILVEPRLLTLVPAAREIVDEKATPATFEYVVPRIPEFPELVSAYYMENLPLSDIAAGDPHVMILGKAGIGKSTALATLALMALDAVQFETLQTLTEQALAESYKDLDEAERQERLAELNDFQRRMVEKLRETEQDITEEARFEPPPPMSSFFPIYVDMSLLDLDLNLYGMSVDPAEPVIRAFQQTVSVVTAQSAPPLMYQKLSAGRALVLLDGFEDLTETDQKRMYQWLRSFLEHYGHNRIVMSGPLHGFHSLEYLGFTPVYLKPWAPDESEALVQNWMTAWDALASGELSPRTRGDIDFSAITDATRGTLAQDIRLRQAFELTLKTLAGLQGYTAYDLRGWFAQYVQLMLPDKEHSGPILREVANLMLERDTVFQREQITEIVTKQLTPNEEEPPLANVDQFSRQLLDGGLFTKAAGNTMVFRHRLLRDYFAAEAMIHDMTPQRIAEFGAERRWEYVFRVAAGHADITGAVGTKLSSFTDILLSNVLAVANWVSFAPQDAKWREEILKRITAVLLAPAQYRSLRERAMAALIASHDPNLIPIFRQAVRSGDAAVRRLGCLGLGALNAENAIADLRPMLVDDERDVQVAAGMALGAIGTEAALEVMVKGLLEGSESLRQVVAQSLAGISVDGHNVLRDAAEHNDIMVRRAAVFGLARIPANWSLILLYNIMINDGEWYVRTAAEDQFIIARNPEREGPRRQPHAHEIPWLFKWAQNVGVEEVTQPEQVQDLLIQVLRDKRPQLRMLAAQTIGRIGLVKGIKALYAMLMDAEPRVRSAAYESLSLLEMRTNQDLPGTL
jgi:hypothetical protein